MAQAKEPSLYEILGIEPTADAAAIKKAFRSKSLALHPDTAGEKMAALYQMVHYAYSVLSDPQQRRAYDEKIGVGKQEKPQPSTEDSATDDSSKSHHTPPNNGMQVPESMYGGPLPRMWHDIFHMPWISNIELRERVPLVSGACPPWWAPWAVFVIGSLTGTIIGNIYDPLMWVMSGITILILLSCFLTFFPGANRIIILLFGFAIFGIIGLIRHNFDLHSLWWFAATIIVWIMTFIFTIYYRWQVDEMSEDQARESYRWGVAGKGLTEAVEKFGERNVALGMEGERLTDAEVTYFLGMIPGLKLFNGLKFPDSENADVDHAILCGKKIAFVDSKAWAPAHYILRPDGETVLEVDRRGDIARMHKVHMVEAVARYKEKSWLIGMDVRGYILVHPSRDGVLTVRNEGENPHVKIVNSEEFLTEVGAWMSEGKPANIDVRLISQLRAQLKL